MLTATATTAQNLFVKLTPSHNLTRMGSFKNAVQTVPTMEQVHDLLSNPLKPGFAGGGDLIYHGGATIKGGRVFNIYLGTPSFDTVDFDNFTRALCASYYLSPDKSDKSPSTFMGSKMLPMPFSAIIYDSMIKTWLDANARWVNPAHTPDTYYAVIMPPGTTVYLGQDASCSSFCGFHERTPGGVYFGVMDDTMCTGCHGSFTPAQGRMMIHAHEFSEWRSDPDGTAWYDSMGWENADKCAWQGVSWGPWFVQPFWVNGIGAYYGPYQAPVPVPQPQPVPGDSQLWAALNWMHAERKIRLDFKGWNPLGQAIAHAVLTEGGDHISDPDIWFGVTL